MLSVVQHVASKWIYKYVVYSKYISMLLLGRKQGRHILLLQYPSQGICYVPFIAGYIRLSTRYKCTRQGDPPKARNAPKASQAAGT